MRFECHPIGVRKCDICKYHHQVSVISIKYLRVIFTFKMDIFGMVLWSCHDRHDMDPLYIKGPTACHLFDATA